jgi:hypothetical protein
MIGPYLMYLCFSSGCLAGSSPALSIYVLDRCRCDFSTRSDDIYIVIDFHFYIVDCCCYFVSFPFISISFIRYAPFVASAYYCWFLSKHYFHIGLYPPRCSSDMVNKQSSINLI